MNRICDPAAGSVFEDKIMCGWWRPEFAVQQAALARKLQQERINAELIAEKAENSRLMKSWYGESRMTQASAAYEANVLVEQTGSGVFDSVQTGANI